MGSRNHAVALCLTFCETAGLFPTVGAPAYIPTSNIGSQFFYIFINVCYLPFFPLIAILVLWSVCHCGFDCTSLTMNGGFPGGSVVKDPPVSAGDTGSVSGLGRSPWRRKWQPTPAFLTGKPHRQRSCGPTVPGVAKETRLSDWTTVMNGLLRIFSCTYWPSVYCGRMSVQILCVFLNDIVFLLLNCKRFLYILGLDPHHIYILWTLSAFCKLSFPLPWSCSLQYQAYAFVWSPICFSFACAFSVVSYKITASFGIVSYVSSESFIFVGLQSSSFLLIHVGFCFWWVQLDAFAWNTQLSQNHLVKSLLSPLNDLGVLVDNQWIIDVGLSLYSLFGSIDPYVFMPVWHNHFLFTLGKWFNDVLQQKWAVHLQ